ncbi:MAG: hypothetical protein SGI92_12545 [Bryobacteraceae bacterium]|nr:hypothetical protein [Bryobacteraceae bacterium]
MTDHHFKNSVITKDPEAVVRMVARAVIRRVRTENPSSYGGDLQLRLSAANPFTTEDESMKQIWQEELSWALQSHNFNLN